MLFVRATGSLRRTLHRCILAGLYGGVLRGRPSDPDRDCFVLSKGHAALALYAALHIAGHITHDELNAYSADGTLLGVHPHHGLTGIDFSTGSLGQGLAMGVGPALAARPQGPPSPAHVLPTHPHPTTATTRAPHTFP